MKARLRYLLVLLLILLPLALLAQVATYPRVRLGGSASGKLAEVDSSGNLMMVLGGTAAQAQTDPSVGSFQRFRLCGSSSGNCAEVDSSGQLLTSINGGSPSLTSVTAPNLYGGTAAGSTLTLSGTSNASPSNAYVILNPNAEGGVGIGISTPAAVFHVHGATPVLRLSGNAANQNLSVAYYDNNSTLQGRVFYAGGNGAGNRWFGLLNDASDYLNFFNTADVPQRWYTNSLERMRLTSTVWSLGANSTTNPALQVDYSAGSVATGVKVTGAAAASGVAVAALSSGTDENLTLDAKGAGTVSLNATATGKITLGRSTIMTPPTAETVTSGSTITADACGGLKRVTAAGAVTTNTTDTFTAPGAANTGCLMFVCNTGSNNITLDNNAHFKSIGGADVVLTADDCTTVVSDGTVWRSMTGLVAN
jgi:hypothetical protein